MSIYTLIFDNISKSHSLEIAILLPFYIINESFFSRDYHFNSSKYGHLLTAGHDCAFVNNAFSFCAASLHMNHEIELGLEKLIGQKVDEKRHGEVHVPQ